MFKDSKQQQKKSPCPEAEVRKDFMAGGCCQKRFHDQWLKLGNTTWPQEVKKQQADLSV
jgi:hypothetical protein